MLVYLVTCFNLRTIKNNLKILLGNNFGGNIFLILLLKY